MTTAPTTEDEAEARERTGRILKGFARKRDNLIPILQRIQAELGYLPRQAMNDTGAFLRIPDMDVYSVVTFYNQFRVHPPGKHSVRVCLGTACHMKGGYITLDAWRRRLGVQPGETTADREFDLDIVACVGCCSMAPVTVLDGSPQARVGPTRVDGILLSFGHESQKAPERGSEK